MEKLTDEQIIKALEICSDELILSCPDDCPFYDECEQDLYVLKRQALDLINRQKAEIERLQKIIVGFMDEVGTWSNKYEVDISTILKLPLLAKEDFNIRNKIKSEAYKEFYDKLTEKATIVIRKDIKGEPIDRLVYLKDIDNTYKELTEGGNEPPKNDFKEEFYMEKLLPCPFCGRQAELRYTEEGFAYIIRQNSIPHKRRSRKDVEGKQKQWTEINIYNYVKNMQLTNSKQSCSTKQNIILLDM